MDEDVAACEAKLGKEPELPLKKNDESVTLSESVTERLQSRTIEGDRLDNYDNYWLNKLACIDESHSKRINLDFAEVEEKLESLAKYAESGVKEDSHSQEIPSKDKLKDCFETSHGETLKCSGNVEMFIQEVDRLMYDAVRKDNTSEEQASTVSEKKLTYAERFKRNITF